MGLFASKSSIRVHPAAVGDRTEMAIINRFLVVGYNVLKPINSALRYDLVIEDADGRFWRVQCKTGRYRDGSIEWSTSTSFQGSNGRRRYTEAEIDYYAIYVPDFDTVYLVPFKDAPGKVHGFLRVDPLAEGYKTPKRPKWARDYEL